MAIIDDCSRFTTVHYIKTKDEATHFIKQFAEMTRRQLRKTPKCIRSDRGRQYLFKYGPVGLFKKSRN